MKKNLSLLIALLVLLPGCWGKKKPKAEKKVKEKVAFRSEVDIPLAEDDIRSYFDDDVSEFALIDDVLDDNEVGIAENVTVGEIEETVADSLDNDFFWVEDIDEEGQTFKTVFFDFDKHGVRSDQEEYVAKNIDLAKDMIEKGENPTIVIEGNACSSAGSRNYNFALSNSRADIVAQRFIAEGVPQENLKIVGRGIENPVLDENGNPVCGDKEQQWVNRRVEIKLYA